MPRILVTFSVLKFETSKVVKLLQFSNMYAILVTLSVLKLERSNEVKPEHPENMPDTLIGRSTPFHNRGNCIEWSEVKAVQPLKKLDAFFIEDDPKFERSIEVRLLQPSNIPSILSV